MSTFIRGSTMPPGSFGSSRHPWIESKLLEKFQRMHSNSTRSLVEFLLNTIFCELLIAYWLPPLNNNITAQYAVIANYNQVVGEWNNFSITILPLYFVNSAGNLYFRDKNDDDVPRGCNYSFRSNKHTDPGRGMAGGCPTLCIRKQDDKDGFKFLNCGF